MFNPNVQFDVTKQWDRMASIYSYLPPEEKVIIETL